MAAIKQNTRSLLSDPAMFAQRRRDDTMQDVRSRVSQRDADKARAKDSQQVRERLSNYGDRIVGTESEVAKRDTQKRRENAALWSDYLQYNVNPLDLTARDLADIGENLGNRFRFWPDAGEASWQYAVDEYLNPFHAIARMSKGLSNVPIALKEGNYDQAVMAVAEPLLVGAGDAFFGTSAKIGAGAMNTPIARGAINTARTLDSYLLEPVARKAGDGYLYRGVGLGGLEDAFESGVLRAPRNSPFAGRAANPNRTNYYSEWTDFATPTQEVYWTPDPYYAQRFASGSSPWIDEPRIVAKVPRDVAKFRVGVSWGRDKRLPSGRSVDIPRQAWEKPWVPENRSVISQWTKESIPIDKAEFLYSLGLGEPLQPLPREAILRAMQGDKEALSFLWPSNK